MGSPGQMINVCVYVKGSGLSHAVCLCVWLVVGVGLVHVPDLQIWGIGTKHVNRFHYDFLLARYLKCIKMVDGQFFHIAKCHFGGHL